MQERATSRSNALKQLKESLGQPLQYAIRKFSGTQTWCYACIELSPANYNNCRFRSNLTLKQYARKNKLKYEDLINLLLKDDTTTEHRGVLIRKALGDGASDEQEEAPAVPDAVDKELLLVPLQHHGWLTCICAGVHRGSSA